MEGRPRKFRNASVGARREQSQLQGNTLQRAGCVFCFLCVTINNPSIACNARYLAAGDRSGAAKDVGSEYAQRLAGWISCSSTGRGCFLVGKSPGRDVENRAIAPTKG